MRTHTYRVELTDEQERNLVRALPFISPEVEALRRAVLAQVPKPRMAEPAVGEVVVAGAFQPGSVRRRWFHLAPNTPRTPMSDLGHDWTDDHGVRLRWDDLHDPQLVDGAA